MFKELVKQSRSYRGYDETRKVTREELEGFVDCARLAPSTANIQPLKYYLACEEEIVTSIQSLTRWAGALPELDLPYKGTYPTAFIVICQDMLIGKSLPQFQKDVGIVAQTMLLAAAEMGLGGCMIGNFSAEKVKETLRLEEHMIPVLVVAIGKGYESIIVTEVEDGESVKYYRDEEGNHYVPKRKLQDVLL